MAKKKSDKNININIGGDSQSTTIIVGNSNAIGQGAQESAETKSRFFVPFPHNPDFVGREVELASLHEMLQKKQSIVGIRPTVLVGLGGIGKTQLAVEYAHVHRNDYPSGIFWLNAINPLLDEFYNLAEKLEMAVEGIAHERVVRKVWDYLDSNPDALVIFDNVLEPSELNMPFSSDLVPANLRCRTLFTTRQRDFPRTFQPFEVKVLPEIAAMRLLLRSRPAILDEHHPEWGWARIVCAELGWLPLALELAAAYLGAYPEVSITGYLERLRTEGSLETVDASEVRAVDLPTRMEEILKAAAAGNLEVKHQVAVSATLQTQWKRLDDEDAKLLFRAAGQFPEASWIPISRLGLVTGIESNAEPGYPADLGAALKKLHIVSLIEELTDERLRLHPLVQEFAAHLSPATFRVELAKRVAIASYDFSQLHERIVRHGVPMILEDVRTAIRFIADLPQDIVYLQLFNLDRALNILVPQLENWDATLRPSFLLQELFNAATLLSLNEISQYAANTLAEKKLQYLVYKSTSYEESPELLRTIAGHKKGVCSVAVSADGKVAISRAEDNMLIVWDVENGTRINTLECAGYDSDASTWEGDFAQGVEVKGEKAHVAMNNNQVSISADGRLAISVSSYRAIQRTPESGNAIVWDVQTGHELRRFFSSRAVLIAGGKFAYSEEDHPDSTKQNPIPPKIQIFDLSTGLEVKNSFYTSETYSQSIKDKLRSRDGQREVSGFSETSIKVLDRRRGEFILVGHRAKIMDVAMSADGRILISASSDKTLKVWDISNEITKPTKFFSVKEAIKYRTQPKSHTSAVNSVAISADGFSAISMSRDIIKVWDILREKELSAIKIDYAVNSMALSPTGKQAYLATRDKSIKVLVTKDLREIYALQGHDNWITKIAISDDERIIVSASADKTIKVWKFQPPRNNSYIPYKEWLTLRGHNKDVTDVALSADGRIAISASMDHTLKVWDVIKGNELLTLHGLSELRAVEISANGQIAISIAVRDNRIRLWNVKAGQETAILVGHKYSVDDIALSANGRFATSLEDKVLNVWSVRAKRIIATFRSNTSLNCCAISHDGARIVAGDVDGRIHFLQLVDNDESQGLVQLENNEHSMRSPSLWKRLFRLKD